MPNTYTIAMGLGRIFPAILTLLGLSLPLATLAQYGPGGKLLEPEQLAHKRAYHNLERALQAPDSVYVLALQGAHTLKSARKGRSSADRLKSLELPEAFTGLRRLQVLQVNFLTLNECRMPVSVTRLPNLQRLDLHKGGFSALPQEMSNLNLLKSLDLSGNEFVELPDELGRLRSLEELNVSNNFLILLPVSVDGLLQLKKLNVSHNPQMTLLTPHVCRLRQLEELDASDCGLKFLPSAIGKMTGLRVLRLAGNDISELPLGLSQLTNLEVLDLRNNLLQNLPMDFTTLSGSIREIDLRGNPLTPADRKALHNAYPKVKLRF